MPWELERLADTDGAGWWLARMQQHWAIRREVEEAQIERARRGPTGGEGWQHGT